jgi:soluble lytic murein transglycosylase
VRLAPRDSHKAIGFWQSLEHQFRFSRHQRHRVRAALALYNAVDDGPHAVERLAEFPVAAQTDATRAWRVRTAVADGQWKAAKAAIDALKPDQMRHDRWRYWQARVAQKLGHTATARSEYVALADQATFYGFLAADRAHLPYSICPRQQALDPALDRKLEAVPGLERALELFAVDLLPLARREWSRAFADLSADERRQAAVLAASRGWYSRAVFALGRLDPQAYALRFPLADKQRVLKAADSAGIRPAWAYAIIRAESAWQPDAHSGAGARGLMQLLPGTAARVARLYSLPYHGRASLYDPAVNIPLGTRYLARLASRFHGNPWLAAAAYNAGPGNVRRWVAARGKLDPERFILTIPFHATRAYVTRVLSFETIYDWRLHGTAIPVSARLPAIGTEYDPASDPKRKQVVCRSAVASAGPTAAGNLLTPGRASREDGSP